MLALAVLAVCSPHAAGQEQTPVGEESPLEEKARPPEEKIRPVEGKLNPAEWQFQQTLSGAVLVGQFTTLGGAGGAKLSDERYTIRKVFKVEGKPNTWRFFVRIQYDQLDLTLPLLLEVFWAADTPVITLTNLTIPALGTVSARVLIFGDRYAGTWQHGQRGGHLFGRVWRDPDAPAPAPAPAPANAPVADTAAPPE